MAVEEQFSTQVEKKKTLDNGKLDPNEVNFLKKQKEWLKDLDTNTVWKLKKDILETNKKSLAGPRVKPYIDRALAHFDEFFAKIFPTWSKIALAQWNPKYFSNKIAKLWRPEQQRIIINMLLAQSIGGGKTFTINKTIVPLRPNWFFTEGVWNYMSITTIRMLHKFQSTDANGIAMRSKADCIIWPKTIQQLFARSGINTGNIIKIWSVDEAFQTGYTTEKLTDEESVKVKILQIVSKYIKTKNKIQYARDLVALYKATISDNDLKKYVLTKIKVLYVNFQKEINISAGTNLAGIRTKKTIENIFQAIPEFASGEDSLYGAMRPPEKVRQLSNIITTADMYIKYLESTLITKQEYKNIFMIKNMYKRLAELKKKLSDPKWDITSLDLSENGEYLSEIFLDPDEVKKNIWLYNRASSDVVYQEFVHINSVEKYHQLMSLINQVTYGNEFWLTGTRLTSFIVVHDNFKLIYWEGGSVDKNLSNIKKILWTKKPNMTEILTSLRQIDKSRNLKYYSGDILMNELGTQISELKIDNETHNFSGLQKDLTNLDEKLKDKSFMKWLLELVTWDSVMNYKDLKSQAKKSWTKGLEKLFLENKSKVVNYLVEKLNIKKEVADTIWNKFKKKYQQIQKANLSIKQTTKRKLKAKYTKATEKMKNDIAYLQLQLKDASWSQKEEIESKISSLNLQIEKNETFLKWDKISVNNNGEEEVISLDSMAEQSYQAANELAFASMAESLIWVAILESHADEVDEIEKLVKSWGWSNDQKKLALIANIKWVGDWWSDSTFNIVIEVTKEVIIQVAIMAVSAGVGNALAAGTRAAISGAGYLIKATKMWQAMIKFGKMASMLQKWLTVAEMVEAWITVGRWARVIAWLTNLVSEWVWFYVSSTMLNNVINDQNVWRWLNPWGYETVNGKKVYNWKWYAQSIAFLGVLNWLWKWTQYLKTLAKWKVSAGLIKKVSVGKMEQIFKTWLKKLWSVGWEMWSLMATDQVLSLAFDQRFKPITWKDMIHMFGMVVGLRMTHGFGISKWIKKMEDWTMNKFEVKGKEWILTLKNPTTGKEIEIKESELDVYMRNHVSYTNAKWNEVRWEIVTENAKIKTSNKSANIESSVNSYTNHMLSKLDVKQAKIPLKNGKHEYHLYDKARAEIGWDKLSPNDQIKLTIDAYKKSVSQDIDILQGMDYVNKTAFAFSKDTKVPGDLDYAIQRDFPKTKQLIEKLQTLQEKGKIINLKITDKINQSDIKFDSNAIENLSDENWKQIETMVNDKSIRIEYDGLVDVWGWKQVSINREFFVETGEWMFEVDLSKTIEVTIDGKKMKFLSEEWYKPYVEDLLVKDLLKDLWDGTKKLKITKRIDDYIDLLSKMEAPKSETTVFSKLKEFVFGKRLSKSKVKRLVASLKKSDRYKTPNHPLHIQYQKAVNHFEKILSEKIDISYGTEVLKLWDINKIMNKTSQLKIEIKTLKKNANIRNEDKIKLQRKIDALVKDLSTYDLSKDEAFPVYHDVYLLTKADVYRIEWARESIDKLNKRNILLQKFEKSSVANNWELDRFYAVDALINKSIENMTKKDVETIKKAYKVYESNINTYKRRIGEYSKIKDKIEFIEIDGKVVWKISFSNGNFKTVEPLNITKEKLQKTEDRYNKLDKLLVSNSFKNLDFIIQKISQAKNFDELYWQLDDMGTIEWSSKKYTAQNIKTIIAKIGKGEIGTQYLPNKYGLREKVKELVGKREEIMVKIKDIKNKLKLSDSKIALDWVVFWGEGSDLNTQISKNGRKKRKLLKVELKSLEKQLKEFNI